MPRSLAPAVAQTSPREAQRIVHQTWTFKDGAPEVPTAFAQTADDYLWIGAPAGLFRFDGTRFELFRAASGERSLVGPVTSSTLIFTKT